MPCSITVVILTLNEEVNLPDCLAGVRGWADRIFVVDAGSTDDTKRIAEAAGAIVVEHPFETHARQWRWALDHLPITTDWVLALDADQALTPELGREIASLSAADLGGIDGIFLNRRQVFRGQWIRHGGYYPKYLLKLFRRASVVMDSADLVDHHFYVRGATRTLRHDMVEANKKEDDISFWIDKHNRYSTLLAREECLARQSDQCSPIEADSFGRPDQRALARRRVWRHMPLYVRPFLYFAYRYVVRCGFLDGKQGAIFHFMQAFWFRLLIDIQLDQMLRETSTLEGQPRRARPEIERG